MIQKRTTPSCTFFQKDCIKRTLNRNRIGNQSQERLIQTMGLSACQGLCITYNIHSKAFCK